MVILDSAAKSYPEVVKKTFASYDKMCHKMDRKLHNCNIIVFSYWKQLHYCL